MVCTMAVCTYFQKNLLKTQDCFSFQFEKVLNNKSYLLQMADFTTMKVSKSQEAVAAQGWCARDRLLKLPTHKSHSSTTPYKRKGNVVSGWAAPVPRDQTVTLLSRH